MVKAIFGSKKFWYAVAGLIIAVVGVLKPDWADMTEQMLYPVIALIFGQGLADMNKEATKLTNGS